MCIRHGQGISSLYDSGIGIYCLSLLVNQHVLLLQIRTDRRQGVVLLAVVCLVALVVLTIAQASIHDWSVYSGM